MRSFPVPRLDVTVLGAASLLALAMGSGVTSSTRQFVMEPEAKPARKSRKSKAANKS